MIIQKFQSYNSEVILKWFCVTKFLGRDMLTVVDTGRHQPPLR